MINVVGDKCKGDYFRQKMFSEMTDSSLKPLGIINVMRFVSSALVRKGQQMGLDRAV